MTGRHRGHFCTVGQPTPGRPAIVCVLVVTMALATIALAACGSSGSSPGSSPAAVVKTAITAGIPKDESSEPPWNGRYVQVDVTTAKPGAMRASDWHVFVNGKEPKLEKPTNILPYSTHAALVAFVFQAPYTDFGTYRFRVVYSPGGGPKVERSWDYRF